MYGMHGQTGKNMSGLEHVRQSIVDIFTTPIGSRPWRRDYGSRLPDLLDRPMNSATLLDIYTESADALAKWEPRIQLKTVKYSGLSPDFGFVGLLLYSDINFSWGKQTTTSIGRTITGATLDVTLLTSANQQVASNQPSARPVVEYSPMVQAENGYITVTLANDYVPDYPVQLSINGILHEQFSREGSRTLRAAHDYLGDLITAYYYVRRPA